MQLAGAAAIASARRQGIYSARAYFSERRLRGAAADGHLHLADVGLEHEQQHISLTDAHNAGPGADGQPYSNSLARCCVRTRLSG